MAFHFLHEFLVLEWLKIQKSCWKLCPFHFFIIYADVLEYYDQTVNSPSGSLYIPVVLRITTNFLEFNHCYISSHHYLIIFLSFR
ncbi:hypothetical protein CsSME_00017049 [Camellia sinensis var. sinensis]